MSVLNEIITGCEFVILASAGDDACTGQPGVWNGYKDGHITHSDF